MRAVIRNFFLCALLLLFKKLLKCFHTPTYIGLRLLNVDVLYADGQDMYAVWRQ